MSHQHDTESSLVEKGACSECGSSDACALYDDGHKFCHSCGTYFPAEGAQSTRPDPEPLPRGDLIRGDLEPLRKRKLDLKTVEKFGYRVGTFAGHPVQIAPYHDAAGRVVAQKLRDPTKEMTWRGKPKAALPLFGQALWRDAGRMVVVTEGELDAMSYAQATGLRWPAVSIPNGAQNAAKSIAQAAEWLERFERVVLMFDMDEVGRAAAEEAARLLTPGKVFIASLPLKDANEMVQAGRSKELVDAAWGARGYRPGGIVRVSDLRADVLKPAEWGLAWPWRGITEATYGIRRGELYGYGAGVGVGKTTFFKQLILSTMLPEMTEDHTGIGVPLPAARKVGTLLLEENPRKTLRTLAGMALNKRIHVPGVEFDPAEVAVQVDRMEPYFVGFDHFGAKDWDSIKDAIRYMVLAEGVQDVFLDHLTALIASSEDDRKALDVIMAEMSSLVEQHGFTLHFISHLTTPSGTAHEEGGRVLEKHFTGSRAIARWSHNMFALERDKQTPDEPTTFRVLKERETGDAVGRLFGLGYVRDTGLFEEVALPEQSGGFKDESKANDF
jgi:twinkle protein